ncbi:MAG: hypothetical protein CVU39_16645 [Chloroflexi bacterium HGW-Chloroflexi-10]|nr:MAG: hypothetical protein CVU39_16645 [Chloroflexi bacterium HGW-Chloroflexi-10]
MMQRTILNPEWGISTCVEVNGIVFIGHHGGHTVNGRKLITIEEQTDNTFQNLKTTLEKIGLGFEDIVNLNVLLKDIKDFHGMHSVWAKWFPREFPARTCSTTAFVDDHCLIQVYGVAYRK